MTIYEITKHYRNNSDVYYIVLNDSERLEEDQLQSIGDNTIGGESYGYRMESKLLDKLPKDAKLLERKQTIEIY